MEKRTLCYQGKSRGHPDPFAHVGYPKTDLTAMDPTICTHDSPYVITFKEDKTIYICACLRSSNRPFCDGSHKKLG